MEMTLAGTYFNTDDLIIDIDKAPSKQEAEGQQKASPPPVPTLPPKQEEESAEAVAVKRLREQMEQKLAQKEEENRLLREQNAQEQNKRVKAEGEARNAGFEREWSDYTAASAAFDASKNRIASLKAGLKAAHEAGDLDKIGDFQAEIGIESAKLVNFEMAKDQLHDRLEQRKKAPSQPKEEPAQPRALSESEQVEHWVTHNKLTSKASQWFRDHPDFVIDAEKNHLVIAADNAARKQGLRRDSEDYFDYINKYVGLDEEAQDDQEPKPAQKPRGRPSVAAPVNNSRGNVFSADNLSGRTVRLKPNLRETAESMYPDMEPAAAHKKYVENSIALIKVGQLPKNFFD